MDVRSVQPTPVDMRDKERFRNTAGRCDKLKRGVQFHVFLVPLFDAFGFAVFPAVQAKNGSGLGGAFFFTKTS